MVLPLLLSCGRVAAFKTFHLQTLGLRNLPAAVSLCTTSGDSKKDSTKNEGDTLNNNRPGAAVKLTNEDLRKFLARKTLVKFPQRTTFPSLERREGLSTKVTDRDSSSSSSSESDSSSDSEEEDSAFKSQTERDTQFSREVRGETSEKLPQSPTGLESPVQHEKMCQTKVDDKLLRSDLSKSSVTQRQETALAKEPQRTELHRSPADVVLQEEKWDGRMPVTESTENVETIPEAGIETEPESTTQEAKPAAEEAQEHIDTSSYKNLQHHEYTPYTFVDFDVELSKLRMPQPSSGRLSPRH